MSRGDSATDTSLSFFTTPGRRLLDGRRSSSSCSEALGSAAHGTGAHRSADVSLGSSWCGCGWPWGGPAVPHDERRGLDLAQPG